MKNKLSLIVGITVIICILVTTIILVVNAKNNKEDINSSNIDELYISKLDEIKENITSVRKITESEGGYEYYITYDKDIIEKIVNALESIEIIQKTDVSLSDNATSYILNLSDGKSISYYFEGNYLKKDKQNYMIKGYQSLENIDIPKEK